jgi:hypothetical protein
MPGPKLFGPEKIDTARPGPGRPVHNPGFLDECRMDIIELLLFLFI